MKIEPKDVSNFIVNATRTKEYWQAIAQESWSELKHCGKRDAALVNRSILPSEVTQSYPAWWSINNIRRPLVLSRAGLPVGIDTTDDGNDKVGSLAAVLLERLCLNLRKAFPYVDNLQRCNSDFCATDAAFARAYYEAEDVKEKVKTRVTPQQDLEGNVYFVDDKGERVDASVEILEDELGPFLETDKVVDVINERVIIKHILPSRVFIDPTILAFEDCNELAFEVHYSREKFIEVFGKDALSTLPPEDNKNPDNTKDTMVVTYEYWNRYAKECFWMAKNSDEFIKPVGYQPNPDEQKTNGLYNLSGFFPMVKPLMRNQPTDEFWPIPEYMQIRGILANISSIFGKYIDGTRALLAKLLFDDGIEGLEDALTSDRQNLCVAVSNLARSLQQSGGALTNAVQYVPLDGILASLQALSTSLETGLNNLYKLIGISDLLQGLITDPTQRTFGERQMTEKYSLNQIEPMQRGMQEFIRDNDQLMCEMALNNFKNESLDKYFIPHTLPKDQQPLFVSAREMLKNNIGRFQIELETDSTIAINEEYKKQMSMEFVNVLTSSVEKASAIAQSNPDLLVLEMHATKFLIQQFRPGKQFQGEIDQVFDKIIEQAQQPKAPEFNKDQALIELKTKQLQSDQQQSVMDAQIKQVEIQSDERINQMKTQAQMQTKSMESQIQQMKGQLEIVLAQITSGSNERIQGSKVQTEVYKVNADKEAKNTDAQISYEKLQADVALAQQNLLIAQAELRQKEEALQLQAQATMSEIQQGQIDSAVDAKTKEDNTQIALIQEKRENQRMILDEREKYATEERLQAEEARMQEEHHLTKALMIKDITAKEPKKDTKK
jgi:hypothetical protein